MSTNRKKLIGVSFFVYLGGFYAGINLLINDKHRADMESIIKKGNRKEKLFEIHDKMASNYEKKTDNFEFRNQFNKYRRILYSYAKGKVLELGVGTGRSFEYYKKDVDVTAIDYSPQMLGFANEKLDNRDLHRIDKDFKANTKLLNAEDLLKEFKENEFDTVVDFNNFHSYCNPDLVYNSIKKVLKPEGILIFHARGESDYQLIKDFYKMFKPMFFMRRGQDVTINWSKYIENDDDWEILYKIKKNYGRTYIYILKLKRKMNRDFYALGNNLVNEEKKLIKDSEMNNKI